MKFSKLAEVFEKLENTSSGNSIRTILADLFKKTSKGPGKSASKYSKTAC